MLPGTTRRSRRTSPFPSTSPRNTFAKAGIKCDAGPVTVHWLKGQEEFANKNYASALEEFKQVDKARIASSLHLARLTGTRTNEYVLDMMDQCRRLGKLNDKPSFTLPQTPGAIT